MWYPMFAVNSRQSILSDCYSSHEMAEERPKEKPEKYYIKPKSFSLNYTDISQ